MLPLSSFLSGAIVTSCLALVALYFALRETPDIVRVRLFSKFWLFATLPAISAAGLASIAADNVVVSKVISWSDIGLFLLWIPVVEELFFRLGLRRLTDRFASPFLSAYGVSLVFAALHTNMARFDFSQPSLPIGPFLLSMCSELLLKKSGSIWFCVVFHSACNATVFIFELIDPRWFTWLDFLFLTQSYR